LRCYEDSSPALPCFRGTGSGSLLRLARIPGAHVERTISTVAAIALLAILAGTNARGQAPRAAGLPLVDLAGETQRQVVVDREPGQYLGHPTTVLLEDGKTILCVYPKGHGKGAIVYKRSEDGGKTWSGRLPTPASWATSLETPTIYRAVDRAGRRRLLLFSGLYPIRLSVSGDDGRTWSELRPIGTYGGIVAMASLVALRDGSHLAMFHDDGRFFHGGGSADGIFRLYQVRSEDGGVTWGEPTLVFQSREVHLCEPGLVRSPDGTRLAALLRENRRVKNSHVMFSDDEGTTWTAPRELPASLTGDRHVLRYAPDGRLFATFRDVGASSPTRGDWVGWVGRWEDLVGGRDGEYRVRLMQNHYRDDCAYPGLELLPDGTFVTTTYGHWTAGEEPYIVSVRLTLAELDARAKAH
jgi:BNR repeat-like domain